MRPAGIAAVLALGAWGCAPPTSVTVHVDADARVRAEADVLALSVWAGPEREPRFHHELRGEALHWPASLVLEPGREGVDDHGYRVSARALVDGADRSLVSSAFLVGRYRWGTDAIYRMHLDGACREVECNQAFDRTCREGSCVTAERGLPEPLDPAGAVP